MGGRDDRMTQGLSEVSGQIVIAFAGEASVEDHGSVGSERFSDSAAGFGEISLEGLI